MKKNYFYLDESIKKYQEQIGGRMHTKNINDVLGDKKFTVIDERELGIAIVQCPENRNPFHIFGIGAPDLITNDVSIANLGFIVDKQLKLRDLTPYGNIAIGNHQDSEIPDDELIDIIIENVIGTYFEDFEAMDNREIYIRIAALPIAMFVNVKNLDQKILTALYEQMKRCIETKVCSEQELAKLTERFAKRFDYAAYAISKKFDYIAELKRRNKESLKQIKKSFRSSRR